MADDTPYKLSIETEAQIAELQKLFAELQSINAEIAKLNGLSFDNISASAGELAKVGSELTAAMNAQKQALDNIPKAADKVTDSLKKAGAASEEASDNISNSKRIMQGFFLEIGAQASRFAMQLPSAFKKSIELFGQQEMATQKLAAAIKAQGGSVSEVLPIMQQFASDIQKITVYGDEQVLAMQSMATSMGVTAEQMDGVIKSAIGLSSALGMDVMTSIKAASAAVQGKTGMLMEYIPSLVKCKTEEEKLAKIQELSASGFAQARAEADNATGKLKQAANAWGDLAEVAGSTFAPVAVDVANLLKGICEWLSEHDTLARLVTGGLTSMAVALAFSKIGGLANVAALFKMVGGAMGVAKVASDGLTASLKANPLGLAMGAVTALTMAWSYFSDKADKTYKANIEASEKERSAIDREIDTLKSWGITTEDNKKRVAEVTAEMEKLKAKQSELTMRQASMGFHGMTLNASDQKELDNANAKIEKYNELLKELEPSVALNERAERKAAEAREKSNKILEESERALAAAKSGGEALAQAYDALAESTERIASLEAAFANGGISDSERVAKATALADEKKKQLETEQKIRQLLVSNNEAELNSRNVALLGQKASLETAVAGAKLKGNTERAKELSFELQIVAADLRRNELVSQYMSAQKETVKTEADLENLKKRALAYANTTLETERKAAAAAAEKANTEKWLNAYLEQSKNVQRGLELDILKAQASGNTAQTEKLQKELRISQIASEIFEYSRKENMSAKELAALKDKATQQASQRYELEKSVTDEVQRQNLAKNAQAQIEDILITREIERLKAAGKYTEAKQVEQEREIRRTLAGMEGLSRDSKKEVEKALRDTYAYRDKQQKRSGGLTGGYSASGNSGGGVVEQRNDMRGGQGPTPPAAPRSTRRNSAPSRRQGETWEEANARYDAEQAQKAEQKAERAKERDRINAMSPGERLRASLSSNRENVSARGLVNQMGATASRLAGTVSAEPRSAPKPAGSAAAGQQPRAASSDPLAQALGDKGVEQETPFQKNLTETLKTISEKLEKGNEDLASIKSSTDALALKKN